MSAADHRTNKAPTNSWRRFLADSSGVSTTEYGLMVAGLTLLVLGSAPAVGSAVSGGLRTVSDHLDGSARAIGLPEADGSGAGNEILRLAVPECQPGQMLAYDQAGLTCADPNFLDRRKGAVAGNRMENGLDMNGYAIRNAGIITSTPPAQPTAPGDYTTKQYVDTAIREALEEGKYGVATQAWVDRQDFAPRAFVLAEIEKRHSGDGEDEGDDEDHGDENEGDPDEGEDGGAVADCPDSEGAHVIQGDGWFRAEGGANVLRANDGDNQIDAGGGDDVVCGMGGDDSLMGRGGNDRLNGGAGDDSYQGGGGADTIEITNPDGDDVVNDFNQRQGDRVAVAGGLRYRVEPHSDGWTAVLNFEQGGELLLWSVSAAEITVSSQDYILGEQPLQTAASEDEEAKGGRGRPPRAGGDDDEDEDEEEED